MLEKLLNFINYVNYDDELSTLYAHALKLHPSQAFNLYIKLTETYIQINDTLFTNYKEHEGITISISEEFDKLYRTLKGLMITIEDREDLLKYHGFINSRLIRALYEDHDFIAYYWEVIRDSYFEEIELLKANKYYIPQAKFPDKYRPLFIDLKEQLKIHKIKVDKLQNLVHGKKIEPEVIAKVEYNDFSGKIELIFEGKRYFIIKPQMDSTNEKIFKYLYNHENKKVTVSHLKKAIGENFKQEITKITDKLNFKGEMKKLFFRGSKQGIIFQNNITYIQAKTIADIDKLREEINELSISK